MRNRIEPPPHFDGDVYAAADAAHVPRTLREATGRLDRSEFARGAFGDDVVDHYVHFLRTEQAAFDRAVTDWERHPLLRADIAGSLAAATRAQRRLRLGRWLPLRALP